MRQRKWEGFCAVARPAGGGYIAVWWKMVFKIPIPPRLREASMGRPSNVARLAHDLTISITPRPEYSGSVQPILSTMLAHAG